MDHRWVDVDGVFQISLRFGEKIRCEIGAINGEIKTFRRPSISNFV